MVGLYCDFLGGFQVRSTAATVAIGASKARALFAYLVLHAGQAQTRDRLAALLWEDSDHPRARQNLRQSLTRLRHSLPEDGRIIVTGGDSLEVDGEALRVDVHDFEHLLDRATPEALERAADLYRGELLAGFHARAPAFEDWLTVERSRLRERATRALEALLDHYLTAEQPEQAVRAAVRLLGLDPLRESAHRSLMILHARLGRHNAALAQYRRCQARLRDELGLAPQPATEHLYRELLQQRQRAGGVVTAPASPATAPDDTDDPGLLGRQAQLGQFAAACQVCAELRSGQSVLLRGEAGIGKSRLVAAFTGLATGRGFACHRVWLQDPTVATVEDGVSLLARALLDLPAGAEPGRRRAALERAVARRLVGAEQTVFLHDLLDLPQPEPSRAMFEAMEHPVRQRGRQRLVAELLAALAARQPVLLVVEDIHWADTATLASLAMVADTVKDSAAMLVMSSRFEGEPLNPAWRGALRGVPLTILDLGPLADEDMRRLAARFEITDPVLVDHCVRRAEGNPLFLEQLLYCGETRTVPGSIQSLVEARLQRLDPEDRRGLRAAACLGERFSLETLRALLDEAGYGARDPMECGLLQPQDQELRFAHALIREAVYHTLDPLERRHWHGRAAARFEADDPLRHAEHLRRADDPRAAHAHLRAAHQQARHYRLGQALELIERGLALEADRPIRHALLQLRAQLLRDSGDIEAAITAGEQALALADDDAERCPVWIDLAAALSIADRHDEALALLDRAGAAASRRDDPEALAQIHYRRGNILFPLGHIERCLAEHQQALTEARRAASSRCEAAALSGLGDAWYQRGRLITAHGYFDDCVALCRGHGFLRLETANLVMRGLTRFYRNHCAAALEDIHTTLELAHRTGARRTEMVARNVLASLLGYLDRWPEVEQEAGQSLAIARRLGARHFEAENLCHLGLALAARGEEAEAEGLLERACALSQASGTRFSGPWIQSALARITPDPVRRARLLAEGEAILREGCVSHNYLHFHQQAMEVALTTGDWDAVAHHADSLAHYTRAEPLPWSEFFIARGRALAAHGRGARDTASRRNLHRLRDEARRAGLVAALPALEAALRA